MAEAEEGLPTSRNSEGVRLLAPCVHTDGGKIKMSGLKEHGVQNFVSVRLWGAPWEVSDGWKALGLSCCAHGASDGC